MIPRWLIPGLVTVIALIAAAALGWWLGQPEPVVETRAPEQRQADGSLVLERRPDAGAKPAQQVPREAKVERVGQVTVRPNSGRKVVRDPDIADSSVHNADPCPPVTIDWSLVREPDGGRRFLASSPDATIVGGVDIPVETAAPPPKPLRWAAGLSWAPVYGTYGVWVERDVPLFGKAARLGADFMQVRQSPGDPAGTDVRIRLGVAF